MAEIRRSHRAVRTPDRELGRRALNDYVTAHQPRQSELAGFIELCPDFAASRAEERVFWHQCQHGVVPRSSRRSLGPSAS
jgi:hypothetical protein